MVLPFPDKMFDVATMALVIFFVPEPAKGVAEMVRVVLAGSMVAAYAWDILRGGFPLEPSSSVGPQVAARVRQQILRAASLMVHAPTR
jgi:ubiquinone/menaquinone biosynthesis C-methylase UbiE